MRGKAVGQNDFADIKCEVFIRPLITGVEYAVDV